MGNWLEHFMFKCMTWEKEVFKVSVEIIYYSIVKVISFKKKKKKNYNLNIIVHVVTL